MWEFRLIQLLTIFVWAARRQKILFFKYLLIYSYGFRSGVGAPHWWLAGAPSHISQALIGCPSVSGLLICFLSTRISINKFRLNKIYWVWSLDRAVGIATGYGLDDRGVGVRVPVGSRIFLFSASCRPVLGSTQPPIQWIVEALSPGVKRPGREADHHLQLVPRSRKCGCIHPLPHTPSWHSAWLVMHRYIFNFYDIVSLYKMLSLLNTSSGSVTSFREINIVKWTQSPWEANSVSVGQAMRLVFPYEMNSYYHVYKGPPRVSILRQMNPVRIVILFQFRINTILSWASQIFPSDFQIPYVLHAKPISHSLIWSPLFNIRRTLQTGKLLSTWRHFPVTCT
jgi:hypothetical protein